MSTHLPAPSPPGPVLPPEEDDAPPPPHQDFPDPEPPADDLEALLLGDWPDDPPMEPLDLALLRPESPDPLDALSAGDVEPEEAAPDLQLEAPAPLQDTLNLFDEPVALPWQTTARLLDRKLQLPALLDPQRATTTWIGGERPGPLRLELGGIEVEVEVEIAPGEPALRVGRDVLAGRIHVIS